VKTMTVRVSGHQVDELIGDEWRPMPLGQRQPLGLGSVELRRTPKAGLHLVRFSSSGRFKFALPLHRDGVYRVGAEYGHRVVPPSEEPDPIKRQLRLRGIPVSSLLRQSAGEPLQVTRHRADIERACPAGSRRWWWETDGDLAWEIVDQRWTGWAYTDDSVGEITSATWAIELIERVVTNGAIVGRIGRVVVWPDCDPDDLGAALDRAMADVRQRKQLAER